MTLSLVLKTITAQRAIYLSQLAQAQELSAAESLDVTQKATLAKLMVTLRADTVSPTLLLPQQQATLEEVVKQSARHTVPLQPTITPY